jgi:hypothetical protein
MIGILPISSELLCNPLYFPLPLSYLFISIVAYLPLLSLSGLVVYPCRGIATRLQYCWFLSRNRVPGITVLQDGFRYGKGLVHRFTDFIAVNLCKA